MFTGIVEEVGAVTAVSTAGDGVRLTVRAPRAVSDAGHGDSIAISGVCLTVVDQGDDWFTADVMRQTLEMSTLADVEAGRPVNVERATSVQGRLGGHIVQGHIDGTGTILEVRPGDKWSVLRVSIPPELAPLVVGKGSVALDGVSLTVSEVSAPPSSRSARSGTESESSSGTESESSPGTESESSPGTESESSSGTESESSVPEHGAQWFEVSLIPETLAATTLGSRVVGDLVNLETDILARHVQRLLAFTPAPSGATNEGGSR